MEGIDDNDLVGRIYDAALDPALWPDVLDRLRRLVDCRAGILLHGSLAPLSLTVKGAHGVEESALAKVQGVFGDSGDNPFVDSLPMLKVGVPVPRQDFIDDENFENHHTYQKFFRPLGLFHDITTPVTVSPDEAVTLFLGREREAGPLGRREAELLLPWIPHLQRAMLIDRQLRMHRSGSHALVEVLDRIDCGVGLADRGGRLLLANKAAESILEDEDGLEQREGILIAQHRSDQVDLEKAIAAAIAGGSGSSLLVQRRSGARPYLLFTVPLSPSIAANWSGGPAAAIIFSDPDRAMEPPLGLLSKLYGLSTAEAAVAMETVRGSGVDAVADKLGISRNTVKTHLNRIFDKTGTRRQAELVRLLLAGNLAAPSFGH